MQAVEELIDKDELNQSASDDDTSEPIRKKKTIDDVEVEAVD